MTATGQAISMRNKHVDVRYHICAEAEGNWEIKLSYSRMSEMVADIRTWALERQKSWHLVNMMPMKASSAEVVNNQRVVNSSRRRAGMTTQRHSSMNDNDN